MGIYSYVSTGSPRGILLTLTIKASNGPSNFSVLTWNILAQKMKLGHMYTPREHMLWAYRRASLQYHLKTLNPDVIFLQELQCKPYLPASVHVHVDRSNDV